MNYLEERIKKDGKAIGDNILKVGSFLNHQVDPILMEKIGKDFAEHYKDYGITKVFTIESSGIAPAVFVARELNVPMVILKKSKSKTLSDNTYHARVHSFTKNNDYDLVVSKDFVNEDDNVLIIDDFLAEGEAAFGAIKLVLDGNASVAGVGIVIEKTFQPGRKKLDDAGIDVYSIARVSSLSDGIEFVQKNSKNIKVKLLNK